MITADHIKIRVQGDKTTLWLSESAIIQNCEISSGYLRKARVEYKKSLPLSQLRVSDNHEYFLGDSGRAWRYGYKDGGFWYSYDNIPDKAPKYYQSKLPSKDELIKIVSTKPRERRDIGLIFSNTALESVLSLVREEDVNWFRYTKHKNTGLTELSVPKAKALAEATAWVLFIKSNANKNKGFLEYGCGTIGEFYERCAEVISTRRLDGFSRSGGRSLRNKIMDLPDQREQIRELLVSMKYGNRNAAIIGKKTLYVDESTGELVEIALHDTIILGLWMNFNCAGKLTQKDIYAKYCADMYEMEETPVSKSTMQNLLRRPEIEFLTAKERHGYDYFRKMIQTYVPSRKLEYANSLWCGDASGTINYAYVDRNGKLRSRKLYTVIIGDVASGYIAGYNVGKSKESSENASLVRGAIASAVSNPLNGKREVLEFISDNHGAYSSATAKEFLNKVARRVRNIEAGNSQGNPAERLFKVFKQSLRGIYNLDTTSWGAKNIENKANEDYFDVNKLPTYEDAKKQLAQKIDEFNNRLLADGSTPAMRFELSKNPQCAEYKPEIYRNITQKAHNVDLSKNRGFLEIMQDYEKTRYELPTDIDTLKLITKYLGTKSYKPVEVYADGENADIYTEDGVFMFTITKTAEACISTFETTEADSQNLSHHMERKAKQIKDVAEFEDELIEDINFLTGHYALDMKIGGYGSSPKERYNKDQEKMLETAKKSKATLERDKAREQAKEQKRAKDNLYKNSLALAQKRMEKRKAAQANTN